MYKVCTYSKLLDHSGIKINSYEILVGCKVKVDVHTSSFTKGVIQYIKTEEDLENINSSLEKKST